MKKLLKTVLATAFMFAMTTTVAFAQASNSASAWTISDDVDLATNYIFYKDAKVNDFIVSTGLNNRYINVDFAKQFKSVYLGLSYEGNFWGYNTATVSNMETSKTTNTKSDFYNNLNAFIGLDNNMAIGLYVNTSSNLSSNKNEIKDSATIKTKNNTTYLNAGAKWSGDFNTSNFTLKPHAIVGYYTELKDNDPKTDYDKINNFGLNVGTDIIKGSRDAHYSDVYLNYTIDLNNKKSLTAQDKAKGSTSDINNSLYFAYKTTYKLNDKLTFGGELDVNMNFNFNKVLSANNDLISSKFIFELNPSLYTGAKYTFVPSKFSLSTGVSMSLPNVASITTDNKMSKTVTTKILTNKDINSNERRFGIGLRAGFDWNITDNLVLDMGTYVPLGSNSNLFNNMSVGISYRK